MNVRPAWSTKVAPGQSSDTYVKQQNTDDRRGTEITSIYIIGDMTILRAYEEGLWVVYKAENQQIMTKIDLKIDKQKN